MSNTNREGKTYRHRLNGAIVVVVKTARMSAGTSRHTIMVLDEGTQERFPAGATAELDEVPVDPFERNWAEV